MWFWKNEEIKSALQSEIHLKISLYSFLDNIKLPTTNSKASGFHICDILELNNEKQRILENKSKESSENNSKSSVNPKNLVKSSEIENEKIDVENVVKDETKSNNEKIDKLSDIEKPRVGDEVKSVKSTDTKDGQQKEPKTTHEPSENGRSNVFSDTLYHYQHLLQNPAVRPWLYMNMNQNGEFECISVLN